MQYIQVGENDLLKRRVYLHLVDGTDGITAKTGQTGTCKVSINGNAPTTSRNSIVEIDSTNLPGDYYLILDQSEIKTMGIVMVRYKASGTAEFVQIVNILAFDPFQPISLQPGFNSVVAPDIDYKRIQKLISDAIGGIPKPVEPKEPDLAPVIDGLHTVIDRIDNLPRPKDPEKVNLEAVLAGIDRLAALVQHINIPEFDPSEIVNRISTLKTSIESIKPAVQQVSADLKIGFDKATAEIVGRIETISEDLNQRPVTLSFQAQREAGKKAEKPSAINDYLKM